MNREEAIRNINALNAVCGQKDFYDEKFLEALYMAIRSLDAWNKVLLDITKMDRKASGREKLIISDIKMSIKKHLGEVENE